MSYIVIFSIFVVGAIIWAIVSGTRSSNRASENENKFKSVLSNKGLTPDQIIFTPHDESGHCLSVNESNKKLSFGYTENNAFITKEYDFSDIVAFEVQVDDHKTGKLSVGGAIVGGVLAGGVGAIIGGTTGKGKTKVNTMHLLVTVNSISNPLIKFSILKASADGKGYNSDNFMVRNAVDRAEKWTGIFNVILKQQEISKS